MAETLLALLLVTTSANGSNLVFSWPEAPIASPRLARALPEELDSFSHLDNPWKASHPEQAVKDTKAPEHDYGHDPDYCWHPPDVMRDRSLSFTHTSHLSPGRGSPIRDRAYSLNKVAVPDEYDCLLGYSVDFLATLLCPQRSMCHQKFELMVDDLAFIGHPVCADAAGAWRFKPEKFKSSSRGRGTSERTGSQSPYNDGPTSASPEIPSSDPPSKSKWLHTFHFALVLDLPDPSSSASGNLSKYFNILYEQIAFTLAAVLYQEQILSNFVEKECDILCTLKESCISRGK
jgi:nitrogen permease regulator 3-like protein